MNYDLSVIPEDSALYMILTRDKDITDENGKKLYYIFSGMPINLLLDKFNILASLNYYMINFDDKLDEIYKNIEPVYGNYLTIAGSNLFHTLFHKCNFEINYIISDHINYSVTEGDIIIYNENYVKICNESINITHMYYISDMIDTFPEESFIVSKYPFNNSIMVGKYHFFIHDTYSRQSNIYELYNSHKSHNRLIDLYGCKKNFRLYRDSVIYALKYMYSDKNISWVNANCDKSIMVGQMLVYRHSELLHILEHCGINIKYKS